MNVMTQNMRFKVSRMFFGIKFIATLNYAILCFEGFLD